jgi:hypothetical protein
LSFGILLKRTCVEWFLKRVCICVRAQKFTEEDMETLKGMKTDLLKEGSVNKRLSMKLFISFYADKLV